MNSKLIKRSFLLLIATTLFLSLFAFAGISDVALAQTNAAGDADASTIRVKLSTGNITAIPFSINGIYSIAERPELYQLNPGSYTVINVGGTLSLLDSVNTVVASGLATITIQEHDNTGGVNLITLAAEGVNRNYLGSMKFWPDGPYVDAVNHIYLEKYLYGVVASEMNNSFPLEALKAQAVAARCYAIKKLEGGRSDNCDISDTPGDQVYKGYNPGLTNVIKAVDDTAGQVLTYSGSIITAYFAASNGGQTDRTENVWVAASPYLKIQDDPYDTANPSSRENTVFFPVGTTLDKTEDMPSLPLQPAALGEAYGASRVYIYSRPDTGSSRIVTLKRGAKFFIYEMNSEWVKAKSGDKIGFVQTRYAKIYNLQATVKVAKRKLMSGASSRSTALLVLPKNANVTIISYGTWCRVNYNGTEGYISKSYLRLIKHTAPPAASISSGSVMTIIKSTYLKATAKTSSKTLSRLSAGKRATVVSTGATWYKMSYNGKIGYVLSKYLQLVIPSLTLTDTVSTGPYASTENIRYTQDDINPKLIDFLIYFAANELSQKNASQPDGTKYYTTLSSIKIKAISEMSGIQTSYKPYCKHNPESTFTPHNASNCPSRDFTGVKMTILLKVLKEDAGKVGGFDRVDYTWNFQFAIPAYIKSATYPQWQVFDPGNRLQIFAVDRGSNSGIDCFKLINRRFGHGIGLSQRGAQQRAMDTNPSVNNYQNILSFYYPGTVLADDDLTEPQLPPLPAPVLTLTTQQNQPSETLSMAPAGSPSPSPIVSP